MLSLAEVFTLGGVSKVQAGGRIALGAGFKSSGPAASAAKSQVRILYRGSTGRTEAENLMEQIAMDYAKRDPLLGAKYLDAVYMTDSRWKAEDGWVKMQKITKTSQGNINIHFNYNTKTGEFDDFKFKDN